MKQVTKTQPVIDRMRAAFGADVDVTRLPVYEAAILNTQPLRKSGGIFKGARPTSATLSQVANAINSESAPIRLEHSDEGTPFGRVFYAEATGDEARALFTVTDPDIAAKIDNGTLDQTSVGFMPAHINCSACGFDFLGASATFENLYTCTCDEGHVMNEGGVHAFVDGVASFFELSMVGKGAAVGARIVGPSESRLAAGNDNYRALAAKAGFSGIALTCSAIQKEDNVDLTALTASLTAATEGKAKAEVKLEAAEAKVTALEAKVTELEGKISGDDTGAKLTAAQAELAEATTALTEELTAILTALKKPVENLPTNVAELKAKIAEHRAEFAALIPVGGKSKPAGADTGEDDKPTPAPSAAFSTRA